MKKLAKLYRELYEMEFITLQELDLYINMLQVVIYHKEIQENVR